MSTRLGLRIAILAAPTEQLMAATPHSSPDRVRFRLRDATADAHRKLEAAMALAQRCADRASYRDLLADLWGIYAPLETALAALHWAGHGIDFTQRAKANWLRADLIALGLSSSALAALPRATHLPTIQSPTDGFGVLYVLEGATLGGQIIMRQIKPSLGLTEHTGARFFSSYGAEIGERWRSFTAALEIHGGSAPRIEAMEQAARATFHWFLHWIDERALRSTESAQHVR